MASEPAPASRLQPSLRSVLTSLDEHQYESVSKVNPFLPFPYHAFLVTVFHHSNSNPI